MHMTIIRTLTLVGSFALAGGLIAPLCAVQADSPDISRLLADARQRAVQLQHDSEQMATFTRSKVSWHSYATQLTAVKEHINQTGKIVADLQAVRDQGAPWQQTAIDRVYPMLKELAANTETTINTLNDHQGRVHMQPFQDYVQANAEMATDLAKVIGDFVDYGNAKGKAERLAAKLEID